MINLRQIEDVKNRLIKEFNPKKIYIFGSYAWGTPNENSDLDIMIIVEKTQNKLNDMRNGIRALRGLGFPKDLLVETELEFSNNSKDNYRIEKEINEKGYLIYEANQRS